MGSRNDNIWMKRIALYKRCVAENDGRLLPTKTVVDGFPLGEWFSTQNASFISGTMIEDRRATWANFLEEIHWSKYAGLRNDARWMEQFEAFQGYVKEYLRFPPMSAIYAGVPVGEWLHNQYNIWQDGRLMEERRVMLDEFHPAWREPYCVKKEAKKLLPQRFDWHHKVPAGDIGLDNALLGDALQCCLLKGIYGCRQYLETFFRMHNHRNNAFADATEGFFAVQQFGEGFFSLDKRKAVFEACFPKTSFLGFNLYCGTVGLAEDTSLLQAAEQYNQHSRFTSAAEMESFVRNWFDGFPENAAQVLYGRFEHGLSFGEIAKDMGISKARVHQVYTAWIFKIQHMKQLETLTIPLCEAERPLSDVLQNAILRAANSKKNDERDSEKEFF